MRAIASQLSACLLLPLLVATGCGGSGSSTGSTGASSGTNTTATSGTSATTSSGTHTTSGASGASGAGTSGTTSGGPCGAGALVLDGLVVTSPLQLSASSVADGQTLSGSFTLCNPTAAAIALKSTAIAARPPGGTDSGGPYGDLYDGPALTVAAGQSQVVSGGRMFTSADALGSWYAYATLQDMAGTYDGDSTDVDNKVTFTVVATTGATSGSSTGATGTSGTSGSATSSGGATTTSSSSGSTAPSGLHVVRGAGGLGRILDGNNAVVQLHGVDRSGTEFACSTQGTQGGGDPAAGFPGFFDGPNDQTGVNAMLAWNINAVRVPLNEDCWLGLNGLPLNDTAADYQAAIMAWVNLLNQNGMVVVLDLHWAAPGTEVTNSTINQLPMADADHAPAFWSSVAATFASNSSVIFDLFNEPNISDWSCWTSGAPASANCAQDKGGNAYAVAGMATMLQAVRNAGAQNVVILGGLSNANDFSSWVQSVGSIPSLAAPLDGLSLDNVAASWHAYDFNSEQSGCPSQFNNYNSTCNSAPVTAALSSVPDVLDAGFPLIIGESGISAFSASSAANFSGPQITEIEAWLDGLYTWMEGQGQSYIAWSWNTDTDPVLVTDYTGTPTQDFGVTYQAHLQSF